MRRRNRYLRGLAIVGGMTGFVLVPLMQGAPAARAQNATSAGGASSPATYPSCGTRSPTADDIAAAKKTYELGNRYLSEADYDRAILYFRDAYRSDCTAHKLLGFIARACELKGDRAEAVLALETYLERVPRADDRPVVEKRIANLKAQLAAHPATSASAAPLASAPAASASPPPEAPPARGHTVLPWVVAGAGAAVALGGGVLMGVGSGQISDAEAACPDRKCASQEQIDDGNAGRSTLTVGTVLLGVGAAAMISGVAWHFLEPTGPSPSTQSARGMVIVPAFAPGYAGGAVQARF